ncbi:MAG TPA: hypothetical protein VFE47_08270, partial [Tepidisphaeraceae bacterium]|nr:hypothetical protein [Tepidisphaeraceae bacterium]
MNSTTRLGVAGFFGTVVRDTGVPPNAVNLRTIIFLPHRPVYKPLLGIELTEGIDAWRSSFFAAA